MGSKLSPGFANIFCHLFVTEIIEPKFDQGCILSYAKYVDDIFCVIRKREKQNLWDKLNKFDSELKFTMESMFKTDFFGHVYNSK